MSLGFQLKQVFGSTAQEALQEDRFEYSMVLQELGDVADMQAKMLREKATLDNFQSALEDHLEFAREFHSATTIREAQDFLTKVLQELSAAG